MKIFLTGEPGIGKSTLLSSIVGEIDNKQGVLTREVKTDGARTSFNTIASNGESFVLCSVDSISSIRVSRYGVNVKELEEFIDALPKVEPGKLLYIDEVGQMQLYSEKYKEFIVEYLAQPNPFLGTLSSIYNDDFTDKIRSRDDVEIIEVTLENRVALKNEILIRISEYVH